MRDLFDVGLPRPLQPYLLVYNNIFLLRPVVTAFLDTRPEIANWLGFFPNAFVLISDRTAQELAELFRERFRGTHFIVTLISPGQNDGWLFQNVWDFINQPRASGRWQ